MEITRIKEKKSLHTFKDSTLQFVFDFLKEDKCIVCHNYKILRFFFFFFLPF